MGRHVRTGSMLVATVYVAALLVLSAQQLVLPQRSGPLAVGQVFAPHLFALASLTALIAVLPVGPGAAPARRALRIALTAVLVLGLARFGTGLVSLPPAAPAGSEPVSLLSWNLEATGAGVRDLSDILLASDASVVGFQELRRSVAAALEADPAVTARYPHRILRPRDGSTGIGLLSTRPILASGWLDDPTAIWARVALGGGRTLVAITAHPLPGPVTAMTPLQAIVAFDATERDRDLLTLRRDLVDPLLASGEALVLFGDLNVTDREPAYADLAAGLRDAHAEVGWGPGGTWRPHALDWLPFGLLRIDLVLVGGSAVPVAIGEDCTPRGSDHCIVRATAAVP